MKITVVAITRNGIALGQKVARYLGNRQENQVRLLIPARFSQGIPDAESFTGPLAPVLRKEFYSSQALVLIMALGIVVRLLAPVIKDKRIDPAVVVLDEKGQFVISALSGHLGGANDLARKLAAGLNAVPVITTATDVQGRPAVDTLARKYSLVMEPYPFVRQINAALVNGETVTFCSEVPIPIPQAAGIQLIPWNDLMNIRPSGWLVVITNRIISLQHPKTLILRPRNLVAGVGCRQGVTPERVREALYNALELSRRSPASLRAMATVDLRANEPGLQAVARELGIRLLTFSRKEIRNKFNQYPQIFNYSAFVQEKIGVGGVCEPVSLLAAPRSRLILPKTTWQGVTIALSEESFGWWEQDQAVQSI